jgi:alpha-1,3-rhamnosyl/mannosyltransferase
LKAFDLTTGSYLLAVGTLEPRKNLKTLIIAYAQLSKHERQRTPLVIAGGSGWGDIGLPGETAALVQDGSLRFVGAVSDAQLRSLYEGAIALMFPSIYEGFGMPVVEAMSCGTPVVHSQDTSMDEITDGLALRLAALDIDGWSAAIRGAVADGRLTDGGERAALMKRARAFAWTISAERVRDAYSALLR